MTVASTNAGGATTGAGRSIAPASGTAASAAPAISARGLTKRFGERRALDGVDLDVPAGAFVSIFGPNGAGKTTLLRQLALLARPSSGTLNILGIDALEEPNALRPRLGLISHRSMLYGDLSADENLAFYSSLYTGEPDRARIDELLRLVELDHRRNDPVRTYSRGMQQRLSIARALVNDPDLVLLDEPYSGLDPHAAELFDELIGRARAERASRTFIMVSHDLGMVAHHATCVICLKRRVIAQGPPDKVLNGDVLQALFGMHMGLICAQDHTHAMPGHDHSAGKEHRHA